MTDTSDRADDNDVLLEESLFDAPPMGEQERMVEAVLFASAEPVTPTTNRSPAPRSRKSAALRCHAAPWTSCLRWSGSALAAAA